MHSRIVSSFSTSWLDRIRVMFVAVQANSADRWCSARIANRGLRAVLPCKLWQTAGEEASDHECSTDDQVARGARRLCAHNAIKEERGHLALGRPRVRRDQAGLQSLRQHGP